MNPEPIDDRPGLQPPRFGLAALMVAVSVLGILFALFHYVGMLGSTIAIFFFLCVVAHVAGNAIGTKLREVGSQPTLFERGVKGKRPLFGVSPSDFAPLSRLRERYSLGKRNLILTAIGAAIGGMLGGSLLFWLSGGTSPWVVVGLGVCASGVLGGIWTFAAASFIQVMLGAIWHASRESRKQ